MKPIKEYTWERTAGATTFLTSMKLYDLRGEKFILLTTSTRPALALEDTPVPIGMPSIYAEGDPNFESALSVIEDPEAFIKMKAEALKKSQELSADRLNPKTR